MIEELIDGYLAQFEPQQVCSDLVVVLFAGIPGSGKSTMSKLLQDRIPSIRVENDKIRAYVIEQCGVWPTSMQLMEGTLKWLANQRHGLVILDSSIDRKYQTMLIETKKETCQIFVVSIESTPERALENIRERNQELPKLTNIDSYVEDHKYFLKEIDPDYLIAQPFDMDETADALSKKIQETFGITLAD